MAGPVKKLPPIKEALERLLRQYGAEDWAVAVRGPLDQVIAGKGAKFAYWEAGDGKDAKKDEIRMELLLIDIRKLERTLENSLVIRAN